MKIFKSNIFFKLFGLLRFFVIKALYLNKLQSKGLSLIGSHVRFYIPSHGNIVLGRKVIISDFVEIQSSGVLKLGNNITINRYSRIIAFESISIGNNVTIAQFVTILDHDHSYEFKQSKLELNGYITKPIVIGNNVWIGDKCSILSGVKIGNNVIIGAHSLVIKDIPDNCIAAGSPAKVIRYHD